MTSNLHSLTVLQSYSLTVSKSYSLLVSPSQSPLLPHSGAPNPGAVPGLPGGVDIMVRDTVGSNVIRRTVGG